VMLIRNLFLATARAVWFTYLRHIATTVIVVAAVGCGGLVAGRGDVAGGAGPYGIAGHDPEIASESGGAPIGTSGGSHSTGGGTRLLVGGAGGVSTFLTGGSATAGKVIGGSATGGSATGGSATGGSVPVHVAARWTLQGATDLPTDINALRWDMPVTGFVLADRMWLLGMSSLSGDSHYSMWEFN